ncbi:MAG: hypothetical protein UT63_C0064G0009 [Candidatus Gottesmanbacteria bacterium GW2011_GWC2_39_8]|uniref:Lysine biosynthesis protein LysW n=1 Tax=Candidatus Gottesmanbacteria bacterium GW2011_GWC2_39_8 TaxID=1618450 RepID=A0A0G0T1C3_9BACT|nr:MAG: hypothetical protein UT63_C0064G0009 [Candidatus Gottesmanbacteria bacterium GW2011_GWC2_39_8]
MNGTCPICDGTVTLSPNLEESEIINCTECKTRLVVTRIDQGKVTLGEAPKVEEDWGE